MENKDLRRGYSIEEYTKLLQLIVELEDAGVIPKTVSREIRPIKLGTSVNRVKTWNFGEVEKGVEPEILKLWKCQKLPCDGKLTLDKKPYYTCDGKSVATMEEVMNYNQEYYDKLMKPTSSMQKHI